MTIHKEFWFKIGVINTQEQAFAKCEVFNQKAIHIDLKFTRKWNETTCKKCLKVKFKRNIN